jgi:hypothetical protein
VSDKLQQRYGDENRSAPQNQEEEGGEHEGAPCRLTDAIPGTPDTDYPTFTQIPDTAFACSDHQLPGYYGDPEAQCQVFHVCQADGRKDSFLCPVGTIFNQRLFVCDCRWNNFQCDETASLYELNANLYVTNEQLSRNRAAYKSAKRTDREYESDSNANDQEEEAAPRFQQQKRSEQQKDKEEVYFNDDQEEEEVEAKRPQRQQQQQSYNNRPQRVQAKANYGSRLRGKARAKPTAQLREYDNWAAASAEIQASIEAMKSTESSQTFTMSTTSSGSTATVTANTITPQTEGTTTL